jgi:hypothetical protein
MIQVAALKPGSREDHPIRVRIETEMDTPVAADLRARDTAARMVCYDWNRNSETMPLKSSTLYIARDLADVAVAV